MDKINRYRKNLLLRKKGEYPGLPIFPFFPKLGRFIPSLPRETMLLIFGATGGGKTQFWKRLSLNLALQHHLKKTNTRPLFIVNLLEESYEEFFDSIVVMLYYEMFKSAIHTKNRRIIDKLILNSHSKELLTDDELKDIEEKIIPFAENIIKNYYRIDDNTYNAFGLYKRAREYSYKLGTHYYIRLDEQGITLTFDEYSKLPKKKQAEYKWNRYEQKDKDIFPIVITDHVSRLHPEKEKTLHQTISDWSFNYCRKNISKNWKWIVWNISQQTVYSENKTYSYRNELNWEALKPSLSDIGDNKLLVQDHHISLGIFNPYRYASNGEIDGIDLEKSNGRYRSTKILKNRIGEDQIELPWYFHGAVSDWSEINLKKIDKFYERCKI